MPMHPSVLNRFCYFSMGLEGVVPWMYLDTKYYVTIGIGNLIDPVSYAKKLPFRWKSTGAAASEEDIEAEWNTIKNDSALARAGHWACEKITDLELSNDAIANLVNAKLQENYAWLKRYYFTGIDSWPADAQMAVLSMAWAMGPGFPQYQVFATFVAACAKQDFDTAAASCRIAGVNADRNYFNKWLFKNAAAVMAAGMDITKLYFPAIVLKPVTIKP